MSSSDDDMPPLLDASSSSDLPSLLDASSSDYDSSSSNGSTDAEPDIMPPKMKQGVDMFFFQDALERALLHLMETGDGSQIARLQHEYHDNDSFRDAFHRVFSSNMMNQLH